MASSFSPEKTLQLILQLCAVMVRDERTAFRTSALWSAICRSRQRDGIQDALPDGHFRPDIFDVWFRDAIHEATRKGYLAYAGVERIFVTNVGRNLANMHPLPEALTPLAEYLQAIAPAAPAAP